MNPKFNPKKTRKVPHHSLVFHVFGEHFLDFVVALVCVNHADVHGHAHFVVTAERTVRIAARECCQLKYTHK